MTDPDHDFVERARRGDLPAFEELVRRHHAIVLRVTARVVGEADCEDVTQDVFLRAFHRLDRFRGEAPFRAWLLRIAHNTALSAASGRRADSAPWDGLDGPDAAVAAGTPADSLEGRERRERLGVKLKGLNPEHRMVLVLRDVEGLTYDEIAEVTGTPLGSVKARLHRARNDMVHALRTNTYDWELPG